MERQAWLLTCAQRRARGWKGLSAVTARVGEKVSGNECPPHGHSVSHILAGSVLGALRD